MAGKRRYPVDGSRPKPITDGKKKKEGDSLNMTVKQKQTSILSFWGKSNARTKTATKGAVPKSATQKKIGKNAGRTIATTPSPKKKSKNNSKVSSNKANVSDKGNSAIDKDRDQRNAETKDNGGKELRDASIEESIEATLTEEQSSVTITPCKGVVERETLNDSSSPIKDNEADSAQEEKPIEPADSSSPAPIHGSDNDDDDDDDTVQSPPDGLSEYEKLRLRNIERNNARLAALGLLTNAPTKSSSSNNRQRPPRKKPKIHKRAPQQPLRRSSRNLNPKPETAGASNDGNAIISMSIAKSETITEPEVEEEETYTVSPLLQYEMSQTEKNSSNSNQFSKFAAVSSIAKDTESEILSSSSNMCLSVTGPRFLPPKGLNAIYSLEFWRNGGGENNAKSNWLVGAGKAGMIALWDTNAKTEPTSTDEAYIDPILSWKAHSGRWIADAKFLPGPTAATPSRLATAGNDGTMCLWDLSTVSFSTGAPKLLHKTDKSLHSSGIFCMDASFDGSSNNNSVVICTGSKDKTVAISSLESLHQPLWRSDFHNAKVGAVQLQKGTTVLASASDDGLVAIHDYRCQDKVAVIQDAHDRPHSVVWDPLDANILCTAGLDPTIKLWDHRNLSKPLVCLQGHVPTNTTKCKRIHRPVFFNPYQHSSFLLTGGQGSSSVSVYKLQNKKNNIIGGTSKLVSRGKLPEDCGDSGCIALNGKQVAVTVDQGEVLLLEPTSSARSQ